MQSAPSSGSHDDTSLLHHRPPFNTRPKRNYLKCEQCRKDRQSCDFENEDSACRRCQRLGHQCGGPTRPPWKAARSKNASVEVSEPSLPISDERWEQYKEIFINYYIVEALTLNEVMFKMKAKYGFTASRRQYEKHFAKWRLRKNARAGDEQVETNVIISAPPSNLPSRSQTTFILVPPTQYMYSDTLEEGQFRLLRLLPGNRGSPLRGHIIQSSLSTKQHYHALSYRWGPPSTNTPEYLLLDEAALPIRASLCQFFHAIRRPDTESLLWVDAVCINHKDAEEWSAQVRNMPNIFSQAARVIIYLDIEPAKARLVRELVQDARDLYMLDLHMQRSDMGSKISAFVDALTNDYWTLIWTVQDVLVARAVTVVLDDAEVTLRDVWETQDLLWTYGAFQGQTLPANSAAYQLSRTKNRSDPSPKLTLVELLTATKNSSVADPRDRVYAVLGLAQDLKQNELPLSDMVKTDELFTRTISLLLQKTNSIEMIWQVSLPGTTNMPSWVTGGNQDDSISLIPDHGPPIYCASKLVKSRLRVDRNVLFVMGYTFDAIVECGDLAFAGNLPSTWFEIAGWTNMQEEVPNQFWRLLVADRGAMGQTVPLWFKRACQTVFSSFKYGQQACASTATDEAAPLVIKDFLDRINKVIHGRRIFRTSQGHLGLAPASSRVSDQVCVLLGASVPIIVRADRESYYQLIGQSYVHGLMNGEVLDLAEQGHIVPQELKIR